MLFGDFLLICINMKKEIKIAGAGLSGLTAGINLIRAGYRVVIYEKKENVALRFNNDFQVIVNWMTDIDVMEALREMNIEINFFVRPIQEGILFGPGLRNRAVFKSAKPIFYLVRRGLTNDCIDFCLKEQFLREGGKIEFGIKSDLEDIDIVATGPKRVNFLTTGYNFETDFPNIVCEVIDSKLAPKVYAYLLVRDGKGTIATALSKNFQNREIYLEKTIKAFKKELGLKMKNKEKFKSFADFRFEKTAIKNSKLYVGEAAGFQDSFVGLGMFFAIRSGYLAVRSFIEEIDYDKLWKREFNTFLKAGIVNRFLFELMGNRGFRVIKSTIEKNQKNLLDLIKKEYKFDWKMKAIYPMAYLFMRNRTKSRGNN